ncbi:hypothetical protein ATV_gp38 [Bicaudavirus pozzuoliense]|uniref:Uncharacterized protein ORF81 n=2 Tax=Acidianus two-tailed virus TaxID=315953 RepID=Y081_ATV|nr:hypothetical protein ATV_gp38 [Acidianus two-tailed virus]Q3V4V0.1 RecName: Full=Uncharacterized protein ORF81 [Acidianus two-tailed virus]AON96516.1 hypothetical protein [Acidianus two-tailed phage variant 1]CAI59864.1 hypothetical protein [Acidianus two-tailed virus]
MSESNNYSAFFVLLFIFTILFLIVVAFLLLGILNGAFATYAHHPLSPSLLSSLDFVLYLFAFGILAVLFLLIAFAIQRKGS